MRNRFLLGAGVALAMALSWADAQAQLFVPPSGPGTWYFGGQVGWTNLDSQSGKLAKTAGGTITARESWDDGFNTGMQEVMLDPTRRPVIFDALGYTPEPWKPTDSVSVVMLFTYVEFAGEGGAGQLGNAALLGHLTKRFGARRGLAIWNDLVFKNDPRAPTVGGGQANRAPRSILREKLPDAAQQRLARQYAGPLQSIATARNTQAAALRAIVKRLPLPRIGSYGSAISGKRTRSGGAIVLGSPQAGLSAPSIFWQLGQHAPGWNCTGFTVPGLGPWTGIGWCNDHAWTLIAGNIGEQVDNYIERIDPKNPRRYLYRGHWRQMTLRTETFKVAKCAPPICKEVAPPSTEHVTFEYTVHGPVRVAVSVGPDGTVKGATVVELTEETYPWVKPLLDAQARYVATSQGQGRLDAMGQFYGQLISSLIQRASLLYDVGVIKRGDAA